MNRTLITFANVIRQKSSFNGMEFERRLSIALNSEGSQTLQKHTATPTHTPTRPEVKAI